MTYKVIVGKRAARQIKKLPRQLQQEAKLAATALATNPRGMNTKKLQGLEAYRLRWGDLRLIYLIDDEIHLVDITDVADRKDIYKKR